MTREELIGINAGIVQSVFQQHLGTLANTVIVVVSNPMDAMTYLTQGDGIAPNQCHWYGGALDSSRFKTYLSLALDKPPTTSRDSHGWP